MNINYNTKDEFLHFIPQSINEAIIATDLDTNILFMNCISQKLTNCFEAEVLGKRIFQAFKICSENNKLFKFDKDSVNKKTFRFKNWSLTTKTGNKIFVAGSISPIEKETGKIIGLVFILFNITEQKKLEESLQYTSMHDALTGLYNRSWFENESLHIREKYNIPIA